MKSRLLARQHDKYFRAALEYQQVAIEFCRYLLPKPISTAMNMATLKSEPTTYINSKLQECFSDTVFSCQVPKYSTQIYLLIEHQSSVDYMMAFRVHEYLYGVLRRHRKQLLKLDGDSKPETKNVLPAVYPLLFYHGQPSPYPHSLDLRRCFYDPLQAMSFLQYTSIDLVDVNKLSDDELSAWSWFGPVALALKYGRKKELIDHVACILSKLYRVKGDHNAEELLRLTLEYLIQVGHLSSIDELLKTIEQQLPEQVGRVAMTIAEQLKQQGRREGQQQGQKEGCQKVALSMLKEGVELAFISRVTELDRSEVDQLKQQLEKSDALG